MLKKIIEDGMMTDDAYLLVHKNVKRLFKNVLNVDIDEKLDEGEILQIDYECELIELYEGIMEL